MKKIIRLTERDITRIINKVLKEETCSNDTPVTITKTSNISEVKVCVGRTEKMKCTNHKVEVCFNGICSKVKIKDAYICDGLEAEIKPSEDSGVFIKNSFKWENFKFRHDKLLYFKNIDIRQYIDCSLVRACLPCFG